MEEIGPEKAIVYIDSKSAVASIAEAFRFHNISVGEVIGSDGYQTSAETERDKVIELWVQGNIQVTNSTRTHARHNWLLKNV